MTYQTEPLLVNVGPQHPSTHGVFRLRVTFDGEMVLDVEPVLGYLHRGTEKLAEGIRRFAADTAKLETFLAEKLQMQTA